MKVEEAIVIAAKVDNSTQEYQALKILAKAYVLKTNLTNIPANLTQQNVDNFFRYIDENGIQKNWKYILIENVRQAFLMCFKGRFIIPKFPFLSEEVAKSRQDS